VEAPVPLPTPHGDGVAALLDAGTVATVAGFQGEGETDIYDPTDGSSTPLLTSIIPTAVADPRGTISGGELYVVGGLTPTVDFGDGVPVQATSVLDLATQTWTMGPVPLTALWEDALVALPDGDLLCEGTESVNGVPLVASDLFNGTSWVSAGATADTRDMQQATLLGTGEVLITGGETSNGTIVLVSNDALLYNPTTRAFSPVTATLDTATRFHTAVAFGTSQAIICGGRPTPDTTEVVGSCSIFNATNKSFSKAGGLADGGRDHMAPGRTLDGMIYFVGGRVIGTTRVPDVDIFDPVTQTMSAGPFLVVARSNASVVTLADGRMVVTGGLDSNSNGIASVEVYTPATWTNPYGY
jgi:hypothetical protein